MSGISGTKDYTVIIINDLNDKVNLSDEEIDLVSEIITQNNYMLIYLGEKYSTVWDDASKGIANVEGNLSDQAVLSKYPLSLGETLLYSIEEYLQ